LTRPSDKEQLLDETFAFNRKLRAFFDARVRERGLTLARARALMALSRRGALNQRELAEELEIETPTLVRVLDSMEKQGLIERRAEENDRRVKQIHMTAQGLAAYETVHALSAELREELMSNVAAEEISTTLDVIRRMTANILTIGAEKVQP
jgi:MarR family transcriptional regulator for hemolysin